MSTAADNDTKRPDRRRMAVVGVALTVIGIAAYVALFIRIGMYGP